MGRLWQTLILRTWKPLLAYLPVGTVVRQRQDDYYRVLAEADKRTDATPFVEFMLQALLNAIQQATVTDQVTDQVARIIEALAMGELGPAATEKDGIEREGGCRGRSQRSGEAPGQNRQTKSPSQQGACTPHACCAGQAGDRPQYSPYR
jgi:hypothetical protein